MRPKSANIKLAGGVSMFDESKSDRQNEIRRLLINGQKLDLKNVRSLNDQIERFLNSNNVKSQSESFVPGARFCGTCTE